MATKPKPTVGAQKRYDQLKTHRNDADSRAKKCAELTVPTLYKEVSKGRARQKSRTTPYQSVGARCVNSLSARLLMTLFPPNSSNFKLMPDGVTASSLEEAANIERGELEASLATLERTVLNEIETTGMRSRISMALKYLVAVGNVCFYVPDEGNAKVYPQTRYVIDRDGMGRMVELVTLDSISPLTLDQGVLAALDIKLADDDAPDDVDVYTHVKLTDGKWHVYQEANGAIVPDSEGTYELDACPWIVTRIHEEDATDYGSGLVYDFIGDFTSLENLTKALLKGAASAAKVLWALDENAAIKPSDITSAESGKVLRMRADHLQAVNQGKWADFNFVQARVDALTRSLEMAFGVHTAVQRDGERVTAMEIRYMAQELEHTLGGTYSILAEDFILPLIRRMMSRMQSQGILPKLPEGIIKPRIVVGVAALGRSQDAQNLAMWAQTAQQMIGPQEFATRINTGELATRLAASSDIPISGLIRSDEEVQQIQQQQLASQGMLKAAPQLADKLIPSQGDTNG